MTAISCRPLLLREIGRVIDVGDQPYYLYGPRYYARIAGRDLVFLLDDKLSARVLGEFRPRTVWNPSIDAAQVDAVRFGYAKNPFTLENDRTSGKWSNVHKARLSPSHIMPNPCAASATRLRIGS